MHRDFTSPASEQWVLQKLQSSSDTVPGGRVNRLWSRCQQTLNIKHLLQMQVTSSPLTDQLYIRVPMNPLIGLISVLVSFCQFDINLDIWEGVS